MSKLEELKLAANKRHENLLDSANALSLYVEALEDEAKELRAQRYAYHLRSDELEIEVQQLHLEIQARVPKPDDLKKVCMLAETQHRRGIYAGPTELYDYEAALARVRDTLPEGERT